MTNEEKQKLKEELKKVVMDHLTPIGYPNLTIEQVMTELPNVWKKICDAGLYKEGMSYQAFVDQAFQQAMLAQMMGQIKGF